MVQEMNRREFDIAIIGMACRFPGADSIDQFWRNLSDGVEALTVFTEEELRAAGVAPATFQSPGYVRTRGVLSSIDLFDANFFGYNPREAETLDPQQRLFLECAWEAFEHASYNVQTYAGRVGVFAGSAMSDYLLTNLYQAYGPAVLRSRAVLIGNDKDYLAARISYKLNLKGPSINVNTACSTSLVAVHLACQSLLHGECDIALAGGASIAVTQKQGYLAEEGGVHSPSGHCRTFDASADGFVPGDGAGVVILKRLSQALEDRDPIHAVIKGSAVTNDGGTKVGFTTPGAEGQAEAVIEALAMAECEAETLGYVEAHGTATDLGDSIEVAALSKAFRTETSRKGFCAIGSVKTNIGHTGSACGIAGLIKTVLALKHQQLPPSLHFEQPNPTIDFANSPFYVNTRLSHWEKNTHEPRRAGVHSFGVGGTNAHLIVEEAPQAQLTSVPTEPPARLLVLSAKTASALKTLGHNLADYLRVHDELDLADVAYTLQTGRAAFHHRCAVMGRTHREVIQALAQVAEKQGALLEALPSQDEPSYVTTLLLAAEKSWLAGDTPDWSRLYTDVTPRRVTLPTYPFERQRYWVEPGQALPSLAEFHCESVSADQTDFQSTDNGHNHADMQAPAAVLVPQLYPRPDLATPFVAPRDDVEQYIATIYQELLGIEQIGVHDDFFEFGGGDSLVATRVITRLNQTFQMQVSLRDIFEMPTIAELAQVIEKEIVHD